MTSGDHADGASGRAAGDTLTPLQALGAAVQAGDWSAATAAVRDGWFDLVRPDSADAARSLLDRVPTSALRSHPLLAMEFGVLLNQTRFQRLRALRYFTIAVRAARSSRTNDLSPTDRLLIRTSESAAFRLLGRSGLSVSAARAAMEQAHALTDDERDAITELPRIFAVLGVSFFSGGRPGEALHAAALGLAEAPTTAPSNGMGALALLCGIHALRGDLPHTHEHLEYARTGPWTDRERNSYSGIFYRIAEAMVALERFDAATARAQLGALDATRSGRHASEHWAVIAQTQAMADLVDGRPGRGLAALDEMVELRGAESSHRVRARLARIRCLLQLGLGNPDAALAILKRDEPDAATLHIERARCALVLGRTGTALTELRAAAHEHLSTRQAAEAAAIDAAVLLRLAPTTRRDGVVERLGSLLERSEQRLAVGLLPPGDHARVVAALEDAGFGGLFVQTPTHALLAEAGVEDLLSPRELVVLDAIVRHGSTAEIAAALLVSPNTVKSQIRSIYRKLGVSTREDAIALSMERHLLDRED